MFEVEFYGNGLDKTNESGKVGLYLGISQGLQTDPDTPFAYAWYDGTRILLRCMKKKMHVNGGILEIILIRRKTIKP